jgi:glycerophosphoryl diester phosphodiesterase
LNARDFPFLEWPGPIAFAHRGGASDFPENTMPAFENAVRLGYRYLETDAHVTADGVLLAFHDDRLDRVTDRAGVIAELPYAEVKRAMVDGKEPITRLDDLLGTFPEARVNIDAKHNGVEEALAEVIQRTNAVNRVCVGAFSDGRIARVRERIGPGLCTSLGPRGVGLLRAASWGLPVGRLSTPCAQVPVRMNRLKIVDERFVNAVHDRGMQVHVWTVDDRQEMDALLDLGVDGLMTDRPHVLREVLEARDQWVAA